MTAENFRCGFVSLAGRSNVGKSTLLNALVGQKLSIVTHKPQTTRYRQAGIRTTEDSQLIFIDTPGLHRAAGRALNRVMNRTAVQTLSEGDVVLFVVEAFRWTHEDNDLLEHLRSLQAPVIAVANKIDLVKPRENLLPQIDALAQRMDFAAIVPVSAKQGTSLDRLQEVIAGLLPAGPPLYPPEQTTDRDEQFHAAEIIREQLLLRLQQELPYGVQVGIESYEMQPDLLHINAIIWVERSAHKAIVIGRQGSMLKGIGSAARVELEQRAGRKVNLKLWVKVRNNWSDDAADLQRFGYDN
ncbi:MAG: GTPase Era [Gammaproteobacteria bacterium]|nr:GTPase Era [Gammaproteobacteria bacterium]NNF59789.1 GTPase Era [Gammaproteobacteria bacterium]NNM20983.1 GTPase Era [Gammaproteobacteria bacterium]